jgi:hypothetical protein
MEVSSTTFFITIPSCNESREMTREHTLAALGLGVVIRQKFILSVKIWKCDLKI